jgi:lipopolysaccharide transport system permease protein
MLFITPVIYPTNITSNKLLSFALSLNPMSSAVELFRASILENHEFNTNFYLSALVALLVFLYGVYYFRKTEYYFADLA